MKKGLEPGTTLVSTVQIRDETNTSRTWLPGQWRRSRSGRPGGRRTNIFAKKKKTSVSLEDCLLFSRGLSSVVCLSWKIQSIEKEVEGSAGYRPARQRLCPRAGREDPQF